jgi:perosamine synthetase
VRFPLSQPTLGPMEAQYVLDAVSSSWISGTGPYVERFESALSAILSRPFVIAVASGTVALEVALQSLEVGPGDEVIVPALTFAAPAAAVLNSGATPVLCDIAEGSWTIDPETASSLMTPRTKAIIAVNLVGHPCDFKNLQTLGVPVIEDAAQAHGAESDFGRSGSFGLISIFSFHANKAITTGEGGCLATDDAYIADRLRLIVNHGMRSKRPYYHELAGRNGRMTNVAAAIGCAQAAKWTDLVHGRLRAEALYADRVGNLGIRERPHMSWASPSCWLYTFTHDERDRLVEYARTVGIDARALWPALSNLPLYRSFVRRPCPVATSVSETAGWLPTWSHMTETDIDSIIDLLERRTKGAS